MESCHRNATKPQWVSKAFKRMGEGGVPLKHRRRTLRHHAEGHPSGITCAAPPSRARAVHVADLLVTSTLGFVIMACAFVPYYDVDSI